MFKASCFISGFIYNLILNLVSACMNQSIYHRLIFTFIYYFLFFCWLDIACDYLLFFFRLGKRGCGKLLTTIKWTMYVRILILWNSEFYFSFYFSICSVILGNQCSFTLLSVYGVSATVETLQQLSFVLL